MAEGSLPADRQLPEPAPVLPTSPLLLRLDEAALASSDPADDHAEPTIAPLPLAWRAGIGLGLVIAVLFGAWLGLRPWYERQQLKRTLDAQILAGELTAAQTTLDTFAAFSPDHPDLGRYQGLVSLGQARFQEAETLLAAHVARQPEDTLARQGLLYLYGLDILLQRVDFFDIDLRKAMIRDWTRLFGFTVTGVNPSAAGLDLAESSPEQAAMHLSRLRELGDTDAALLDCADSALALLQGESNEARQQAYDRMATIDGINLPSFQAFLVLAEESIDEPLPTPPLAVPPTGAIPQAPSPGSIIPLDGESPAGPAFPSPAIGIPGRGGGALAPSPGLSPDGRPNETPSILEGATGRGPAPRVRPNAIDSYFKVLPDGTEEKIWYVRMVNADMAGNQRIHVGEEVVMPVSGYVVKVRSIDPEAMRVVFEEKDRAVYVYTKARGSRWSWNISDPENDFGGLRKERYGTEQR